MFYTDLHEGKTIIHIVGGQLDDDLKNNIPEIARWFVENDITPLWGDNYEEEFNPNHPVKLLVDEIVKQSKGAIKPIRILQLGSDYNQTIMTLREDGKLIPLVDEMGTTIGFIDKSVPNQTMIYTHQQQDRQKAYYNNSDGLLALNGGVGVGYEQINSFLYTLSGDLPPHFKIMTIDHKGKFKKFLKAYLDLLGVDVPELTKRYFDPDCYFSSASDFVHKKLPKEDNDTF